MKETEVKFIVRDLNAIARMLKKLGGRCAWKGREESSYFDTPAHSLRRKGIVLRLRKWKGDSDFLTLKVEPKKKGKKFSVRKELQTAVDSAKMREIFKELGFGESFRYTKNRAHWKLGKTSIELDSLKNKSYVEIEGTKKEIERLAPILGLDWKHSTTKSYIELLGR
ncbi:MAG: class IV adenylate cyclase [Candidatus Paceibacterota bacterium]|jgi:adenylate cyclase class 2